MAVKNHKLVERARNDRPLPIASAGFSAATLAALARSAKRLREVPPRAFSKEEIESFFKETLNN